MKLLIFVNKFNKNDDLLGFFVGWVDELLKYAEKITIIAQESGEFNPADNLKVISLNKAKNTGKIKRFVMFNNLLFGLRNDYDSLLIMMAPGWVIASFLMAKLLRKRIFLWYAVWRGSWKLKLAEKLADKIFCSVKMAFPFETPKLVLLGQGVDTSRFIPDEIRRQKNKLLFLGRISPVKKIEFLLYALAELRQINNSGFETINLDIVGNIILNKDREYLLYLQELAEKLNLSDKISWKGRVSHEKTVDYYQNSDLFINLTPTGSFDKTMLEAMSCGNLVLVSNEALKEFLNEKLSELILFKENDPLDLAKKISKILSINTDVKTAVRVQLREIIVRYHSQKQWAQNLMKNLT